jgi:hypothetical protein
MVGRIVGSILQHAVASSHSESDKGAPWHLESGGLMSEEPHLTLRKAHS